MRPFSTGGKRYWIAILAATTATLVVLETLLLALTTSYFSGGFQSTTAEGPLAVSAYLAGAVSLDVALILCSWTICLPVLRRYRGGPLRCASIAVLIGVVPATLFGLVQYGFHIVLGKLISTSLLGAGASGSSTSSLAVLGEFVPPAHVTLLLAVGALAALVPFIARRIDLHLGASWVIAPRLRQFLASAIIALLVSLFVFGYSVRSNESLHFGLSIKASGRLLAYGILLATDWDGDDYGFLAQPVDFAPLDAQRHPYAIDEPGNGIDENGIAGDRPFVAASSIENRMHDPRTPPASSTNPHVLFIFLETFRADLLDTRVEGQPVTPFLSELARQGARSDRMFVHSPWTLAARDHLFLGAIVSRPESPTLTDDFLERGYEVAHFSGQDDSYGESARRLGFERSNHFYDARQDIGKRTTRSTASVSLQVSWKTLLGRVEEYLDDYRSEKPLFLYVNIVDTHFPYTHSEIDEIVASPELDRQSIRSPNALQIYQTYANTAANVDRAVERLVAKWRATFDENLQAIVVTGDHGESFYESGTLGHGQSVGSGETRVPLIVHGIGGEWPEPIGISDLRRLLALNLGVETGDVHPQFVPDPDRSIFQYLGNIPRAEQIALRRIDGVDVLDTYGEALQHLDENEQPTDTPPSESAIHELVWMWETIQALQCPTGQNFVVWRPKRCEPRTMSPGLPD